MANENTQTSPEQGEPNGDNQPPTCERCGDEYSLRDGCEVSKYCDPCAQERVSELESALASPKAAQVQEGQAYRSGLEEGAPLEVCVTDADKAAAKALFDGRPTALLVNREMQDAALLRFAAENIALHRIATSSPSPESGGQTFEDWWEASWKATWHQSLGYKGRARLAWNAAKAAAPVEGDGGLPPLDVTHADRQAGMEWSFAGNGPDLEKLGAWEAVKQVRDMLMCRERQLRAALSTHPQSREEVRHGDEA